MPLPWIILLAFVAWLLLIGAVGIAIMPWLANAPGESATIGLIWRCLRIYSRIVHRAQYRGFEDFRQLRDPGPIIVVSNHTGAVDPLLIQAGCRFHIRWMMASEMMTRRLDWLWRQEQTIPVDRDG